MGLRPEELALLKAGLAIEVRSIVEGAFHVELHAAARAHSEYMARVGVQGHQNFDKRFRELSAILPGLEIAEIANESWEDQEIESAAKEMFRSWKLSSGHWATANGPATYQGYSMARGKSRRTGGQTWYATGLVAREANGASFGSAIEWLR